MGSRVEGRIDGMLGISKRSVASSAVSILEIRRGCTAELNWTATVAENLVCHLKERFRRVCSMKHRRMGRC